jgi:hypothetical protein
MKIPQKYGGLGFSQLNYVRAIGYIASHCASTAVMLSAHQSIGVPQPLKLFGTEEQKRKFLTRFGKNRYISAFALTENNVGSDPAQMLTKAEPVEDGNFYILNGEKLWCTNGPIADILVVMAQTPPKIVRGKERKQITAFIIEKTMPGVEVTHRCRFMGLHGMQNGVIKFTNVKVPKDHIISEPGKGLKLALETLNTGRLTVPSGAITCAKQCLRIVREWANKRKQWGATIGEHEAITSKIANMAATIYATESITELSSIMADESKADFRLEAAISKLFGTEAVWRIADDTVQIRGGRGYETADSLRNRGEDAIPVERILRDARINTIIEGTSEIMHLLIAREIMDSHLKLAAPILSSRTNLAQKFTALIKTGIHYAFWYPRLWITIPMVSSEGVPKKLKGHFRYVEKSSKKLARNLFHAMMIYQAKLEKKQLVLFRLVNIGMDLFVMAASISRAVSLMSEKDKSGNCVELCDIFCRNARNNVNNEFRTLFRNNDERVYKTGRSICKGEFLWLEEGVYEG